MGTQPRHDVVAVKQQRKRLGPLIARYFIEPCHFRLGRSVNQEAENVVDRKRIVDRVLLLIGLTKQNNGSSTLCVKESFHRGQSGRLMSRHVFSVQVAGRKNLRTTRKQAGNNSHTQKNFPVISESAFENIEGAESAHDESTRNYSARHIVRILNQSPPIRQKSPKTRDLVEAIGQNAISNRVLHPGVRDDDEKARNP